MRSLLFFALTARVLSAAQNAPAVAQGQTSSAPVRSPQAGQQAKEEPPGRIEGTVTNAVTGEPLKRANVVLVPAEPRPDTTPYSTSSDPAGHFAMVGISPGKYRMWVERTGFVREEYGSRGLSRMGATLTVAPGQSLGKVDLRMQPHAVIAGHITDEDGEPVANVQVQTMTYRYMQGKRQLVPAGGSGTNDLGEYRIFGLAPGRYYLSATIRNTGMMWNSVDRTAARANEPDEGYAATYYPGTADLRAAAQIQAVPGKPLMNMDMRLARVRTSRVRGRIAMSGGRSISRPMVMLTPRGGFMWFDRGMTTTHGPDGQFELRGVSPGSYYLVAQVFDSGSRQFARIPLDVGSSDVEGIELSLAPGQEVTGVVRVEGDTPVTLSSLRVSLEAKEMTPFGGGANAVVKDDGTFSLRDVVPDTYRVRAMGGQNPFYVKSVTIGTQDAKDGEVTVNAGGAAPIAVILSAAGGQISGTAKDSNDAATPGATVVLVPETSKRDRSDLYKSSATDQYGKFTFSAIPPGSYTLYAWDNVENGAWTDADFLQTYDKKGTAISIQENAKETIDLKVLRNESGDVR